MSLVSLIHKKQPVPVATAIRAIPATDGTEAGRCGANSSKNSVNSSSNPLEQKSSIATGLDPDRYCWPHSEAMNSAEIDRFIERRDKLIAAGIKAEVAERIADEQMRRDRHCPDLLPVTNGGHK